MPSRETILNATRRHLTEAVDIPDFDESRWLTFEDPLARFEEVLNSVGGELFAVPTIESIDEKLGENAAFTDAKNRVSLVEGAGSPTIDIHQVADPHQLDDVDFALLPARFGVAENAAVWLDLRKAKHRVICVLAQHVAIVLPKSEIIHNMHQAYDRLTDAPDLDDAPADFRKSGFGLFMSGPSKTADIEQSLVIGAHGAKSMTVYLVES
ncbi:LutC/YkgG family protein [Stratiformator vulcanicus]|uniref:Lactate utilization protein C n=1 Tax=Stratiformator vulcanicus TaxID=2527980 RepID=A0A517QYN0_9PLAN|nr:LUD domain-containing protein [Stratiformator vulcanicus]QDT36741.1 Lactate utilization protein C [Stratiformator vulcanicus]